MRSAGRFESLDALRGLAVLGMAWSGMLPDTLPAWMYHAQLPPPNHVFDDRVFGITWVDLVFPFFLFAMGAAIPLALSRRLDTESRNQGPREEGAEDAQSTESPEVRNAKVAFGLCLRGLLLALFAVYGEHLRAGAWASAPNAQTWWITLLGFALLLLMFIRWPAAVPKRVGRILTAVGWVGATLLIATHIYPPPFPGQGFNVSRNDIILLVLANVAVSGGLLWMITRSRPWWRFAAAAAVAFVFLTQSAPDSLGKAIWDFPSYGGWERWQYGRFMPIFYHFEYQKYLLILIPGTVCGDFVLRAMRDIPAESVWRGWRRLSLFLLGPLACGLACWGLFAREVVSTSVALIGVAVLMWVFSRNPSSPSEHLTCRIVRLGAPLLFLGLLAEPLGGGIRKDEPTLSYFLVTAGLACLVLSSLQVLIQAPGMAKVLRPAVLTGMNPILGYVTITNFVIALDGLTGYTSWLSSTPVGANPWAVAYLSGAVKTALVAVVASAFTSARIFLRA